MTELLDLTNDPGQIDAYAPGLEALIDGLADLRSLLKPRRRMSASEWAEEHGYLSKESNAQSGRVRLYGYQKGVLDAMSDPRAAQVTVLKGARVGYSRMITLAVGYYLEHDPAPVLLAQPTVSDVEDFGRTEILPMLRDTEVLKPLVRPIKRGDANDTLTDMMFANGSVLKLRGAASDDAFRRISTRINIADEIDADGWRGDRKDSQGDKLKLMATRGATFWNSKVVIGSTPVWRHNSKIYREWLQSDQRRYHVPCPHCGSLQYLKWGGADVPYGIKWQTDDDGVVTDAWYVCEHCEERIDESEKYSMDANGCWIATAKPKRPGNVGFHLWAGMSLFPKAGWKFLAQEWLEACRKPELLQPFVNLVLGEPYEDRSEHKPEIDLDAVSEDLEVYDAEVPAPVVMLTAGCDVQSGSEKTGKPARVEVSVWGWGRGEESWLIGHHIIEGGMDQPATQEQLDALLSRPFQKSDGTEMFIQAAAIDMGGHFTEAVRDFARKRVKRHVWAIKGRNLRLGSRSPSVWPKKASRDKGDSWYMIDTQLAKDIIGRRFRIKQDGPGRIHFPGDIADEYLKGLAAESRITDSAGRRYWKKRDPQAYGEPLDCLVYAYAALCGLKMSFRKWSDIDRVADAMGIAKDRTPAAKASEAVNEPAPVSKPSPAPKPQPAPAAALAAKPRPKVRMGSSFMSRR